MNEPKIYVGKGKKSNYGIKVSICLSDLPAEHITTANNGKKYINLEVSEMKQPDQWGKTHTVTVDTWKPTGATTQPAQAQPEPEPDVKEYSNDGTLPF
jgi:hypothetical protein